ncbi:DEKNAAC104824 [Brettanomyces naardenensis]|uniref:DEKNAAC104824 n=1 Tax=Brettanomyces naardenensis TaxID=13370 RepID=A0A448YRY2_BRENA|nr:DEKNAAC104824 [Brettanomyces naardenensis]
MPNSKHLYGPPKRVAARPYSSKLESFENFRNCSIANEYLPTIVKHMKVLEARSSVNPSMIDLQPEVKWFMRPYLVNFIIQMHSSLKLKPQTLFLCWNIIDRYCAKRIAFKQHYQLIGCTALWIAAKYEDKKSRVPSIGELGMMCSNVYEESMFREMEVHILSTLGWSVGHCSLEEILQLCVKFTDPDGKETLTRPIEQYKGNSQTVSAILAVARYLCELSLYERDYLAFPTTLVGITAFLLSCSMLSLDCGSKCLNRIYHDYRLTKTCHSAGLRNVTPQSMPPPFGQLPTPITPRKDIQYFDEDCDCAYDSDIENKDPADDFQSGPFISGFEGFNSINKLRSISVLMLKSLLNPPEVLVEKYTPLGVIAVVKNFVAENHLNDIDMKDLSVDCKTTTAIPSVSDFVFDLSNLLLNFESNLEFVTEQAMQYISHTYQSPMASKSYSPFNSPSNLSSFSSASSQTTYDSCYEEIPTKGGDVAMTDEIKRSYLNSSPFVDAN